MTEQENCRLKKTTREINRKFTICTMILQVLFFQILKFLKFIKFFKVRINFLMLFKILKN